MALNIFDTTISELKENDSNLSNREANSLFGTTIRNFEVYNIIGKDNFIVKDNDYSNIKPDNKGLLYFSSYKLFPIIHQYLFNSAYYCSLPFYGYGTVHYDVLYRKYIYESHYAKDYLFRSQAILFTEVDKFIPKNTGNNVNQLFDSLRGFRDILKIMIDLNAIDYTIKAMDNIHTKGLSSGVIIELCKLMNTLQRRYDRQTVMSLSDDEKEQIGKKVYLENIKFIGNAESVDEYQYKHKDEQLEKILSSFKKISTYK